MNQHPEEVASDVSAVWQRPGWYLIQGARAPEAQAEADEQACVHKGEQVVDALEEVKRTGNALVLNCIQPQHVPNALDYYGADFLMERRGDDDITACVAFEAGWWTYTVEIRYRWDPQEQMWEYGQELLQVDYEDGEINLWHLADLLLEDGFSLESDSYSQSKVRAAHPWLSSPPGRAVSLCSNGPYSGAKIPSLVEYDLLGRGLEI